MTILDRELG